MPTSLLRGKVTSSIFTSFACICSCTSAFVTDFLPFKKSSSPVHAISSGFTPSLFAIIARICCALPFSIGRASTALLTALKNTGAGALTSSAAVAGTGPTPLISVERDCPAVSNKSRTTGPTVSVATAFTARAACGTIAAPPASAPMPKPKPPAVATVAQSGLNGLASSIFPCFNRCAMYSPKAA